MMSLEENERDNQPLLAVYGDPEGQNTTPNKTHIEQNVSDNKLMNQKNKHFRKHELYENILFYKTHLENVKQIQTRKCSNVIENTFTKQI